MLQYPQQHHAFSERAARTPPAAYMATPKEFRKNAEDCLKPARETKQIYAKLALIDVGTEFRVMAHLGRDATPRTAEVFDNACIHFCAVAANCHACCGVVRNVCCDESALRGGRCSDFHLRRCYQ
jgi:hypothetical protein